jgi:hypothetical protein
MERPGHGQRYAQSATLKPGPNATTFMTPIPYSLTMTRPGRLATSTARRRVKPSVRESTKARRHDRLPIFWLPPIRKSLEWVIPVTLTASQRVCVHCTNFLDSGGKEAGNSQNSHFG